MTKTQFSQQLRSTTAFNRTFNRLGCYGENASQPTMPLFNRLQPDLQPAELLGRNHNPAQQLHDSTDFNRAFNRLDFAEASLSSIKYAVRPVS